MHTHFHSDISKGCNIPRGLKCSSFTYRQIKHRLTTSTHLSLIQATNRINEHHDTSSHRWDVQHIKMHVLHGEFHYEVQNTPVYPKHKTDYQGEVVNQYLYPNQDKPVQQSTIVAKHPSLQPI